MNSMPMELLNEQLKPRVAIHTLYQEKSDPKTRDSSWESNLGP